LMDWDDGAKKGGTRKRPNSQKPDLNERKRNNNGLMEGGGKEDR